MQWRGKKENYWLEERMMDLIFSQMQGLELPFRRIHERAILPKREHPFDAGMDVRSVEGVVIKPGEEEIISTGWSVEVPKNCVLDVRSRSGYAANFRVFVLNAPGTVDCGYTGELKVLLMNLGVEDFKVVPTQKIAQIVLLPVFLPTPVERFDDAPESERGDGGLGSTGAFGKEAQDAENS